MHGSLHLFPTQDNFNGQSWLIKHSGRQFGGAPYIPVRQEQTALFSRTLQSAFDPHGDGIHGETGGDGDCSIINVVIQLLVFITFLLNASFIASS